MKSHVRYLVAVLLIPFAFLLPNMQRGTVMLPLDLLRHLQPFSNSIPASLQKIHNSSLSDLVTLYYPSVELLRSSDTFVPLWNPYSFFGVPALANAQNGTLFPLTWLFKCLSPGPATLALALGKFWISGIFGFLFFRRVGFQPLSSLLGSVGFMLCGHMIVWFGYPTSFPLSVWPFLMWALEGYVANARLRNLAWLAIAFGLLFIGGQPQTGFLIGIAAALYLCVRSALNRKTALRVWVGFAISGFLGLCLAAPQILPFLEYLRLSSASLIRGSMGHYGWKHYPWFTLLSWIMPRFFGDVRNDTFWGFSSLLGEAVYIGAIPLIFAIIGLFRRTEVKNYYWASVTVFLFGALGLYIRPLAAVYLSIPLLSSIDNNKLVGLVAFGLISFSVMGFEALLIDTNERRLIFVRFVWIAIIWMSFGGLVSYHFRDAIREMKLSTMEFRDGAWLAGLLITGCTVLWLRSHSRLSGRQAASLIVIVTLIDLFRIWIYYIPSYSEGDLIPGSRALAYLQENASNDRMIGVGDILPPEISILYRLQDARGYDGMTPYSYYCVSNNIDPGVHNLLRRMHALRPPAGKWTHYTLFYDSYAVYFDSADPKVKDDLARMDYWSSISKIEQPQLLSICGVRYILSKRGSDNPGGKAFRLVHQSDADVWENSKVLPRAYVATRPIAVKSDQAALAAISSPDFPYDRTAVIRIKEPVSTGAEPVGRDDGMLIPAKIQMYGAEKVQVQAAAPQGGWLILSDLYYPGWKATCDGNAADIFPGNYLFRAVRIPPGSHVVEFTYQPASFRIGCLLALSAGTVIVLLIVGNGAGRILRHRPIAAQA